MAADASLRRQPEDDRYLRPNCHDAIATALLVATHLRDSTDSPPEVLISIRRQADESLSIGYSIATHHGVYSINDTASLATRIAQRRRTRIATRLFSFH